ncbi:hypothetical protein ACROYT_G026523 [Oculina patagonica]
MSANGITMESRTEITKEPDVLEEVQSGIDWISRLCFEHGLFCATHPKLVIFFTAVVIFTCSAPLLTIPLFGGSATIEWITLSSSGVSVADSRGSTPRILQGNDSTIPRWFVGDPVLFIQQFILMAHVSPWRPHLQSNLVIKEALKPAFQITKFISDFQYQHGSHIVQLNDVCLKVDSGPNAAQLSGFGINDQRYLPSKGCLLLSPANLWNRDIKRFNQDASVLDDLYLDRGRTAFNIGVKEFILGLPLKQTGIYPSMQTDGPHHVIQYGLTLVLSSHDSRYIDELSKQLKNKFPLASPTEKDDNINKDNVVHIYYKGEDREFIEFAPLCVTYFIVFLYLAFSVGKIEMVKSKWGLAFSAVISVIASLVMASGLCSFFGLVTTLDSSEIFPYLVIVVGVENILVITKSVVSTPVDLEVKIRVAQGLSKEGWYIIKNLFTELAVLLSGYFTFVPAVQEFCLFAMVCLLSDFFLQMVLFVTVLSIDIRRMELSDLQRQPAQVRERSLSDGPQQGTSGQNPPSPVPSPPHSSQPVRFFGLLPPLPSLKLNTQTTPPRECPVLPKKLPKRLNFAYFWARTRIVQKACMACLVFYFIYILSSPSSQPVETSQDQQISKKSSENVNIGNSSLKFEDSQIRFTQGGDQSSDLSGLKSTREFTSKKRTEFSIKPPSFELWKGLYQRHWPQLLNYYNISLLGRYVTVLPPVHLGINIDTDIFVSDVPQDGDQVLAGSQSLPSVDGTVKIDHSLGSGQETGSGSPAGGETRDPKYYHNALSCVILGVVVMIVLFFVCKFLNDLQVSPRSGRGRKGKGHQCDALVESVPISLREHTQNVEHLKCTVSSIISVCLSGQICVWDIATWDCLRVINRKSHVRSDAPPKRKTKQKKSKHRRSVDADSGYTTQRFLDNLPGSNAQVSPRPLSDPECTPPQHIGDENGTEVGNGAMLSPNPESNFRENGVKNHENSLNESFVSGGSPKSTGYDFSKYANGMDIPTWSPRVSSRGSFTSSWSSADGEDVGWLSSSEGSGDEQAYVQTDSCHDDRAVGASVWCVDCRGDLLVTGCSDGTIEIWSVSSGTQVYVSRDAHIGVTKLSFLPGSPQIVVARLDGTLEFLSLGLPCRPSLNAPLLESSPIKRSSPRIIRKSNIQTNDVPGMTHSEDPAPITVNGSHAYTSPEAPLCRISHKLRAHHQPICVLGVTEGRVITGSHDRTLKVFRTDECVCVYTLHGHADSITSLTVDKTNNRQVVSGAANGGVRVWDVVSGECLQHLRGHVKSVTAVTCTAEHLLSVSLESVLCIWDRARGECLHRLKQFPDLCSNVAMLSQTLFITGGQGHISVWDVLTGRRVKTVLLGDDDTSVFVRYVNVCDNATVVCDYGKELKIVTFPAVMDKAE